MHVELQPEFPHRTRRKEKLTPRSSRRAQAPYVELHAHSSYSFLDGASLPEELAVHAAELGYTALALTDHDGLYGSLEFAHAAKHFGVRPITGAELTLADRSHVTLLVAVRHRMSLDGCEAERRGNHECVLLAPAEARERFAGDEDAVARTVELAERLTFDLTQELGYRYPDFSDSPEPAIVQLANVCNREFEHRYPSSNRLLRSQARARLDDELNLIDELGLAGFFLLHWDVLELARECALEVRGRDSPRHALPPGRGRGSSFGSLVCYLTGLSPVQPGGAELSLGRFPNPEPDSV